MRFRIGVTMSPTPPEFEVLSPRPEITNADADTDADGSETSEDSLNHHGDIHDDLSDTHTDAKPQSLSIYEKKALLVTRELDEQGMGRYQWMVFFLCGFGYLLDLLWAQAFGLVVTPMQKEFGFDDTQLGNIFTAFSIGLTAGAFIWG